jgi:hypothetical protein
MPFKGGIFVLGMAIGGGSLAVAADPEPGALLRASTHALQMTPAGLDGPGADVLKRGTARAQFVLIGEGHHDHDTPLFASALFKMLRRDHGFDAVVVEQDPLGIETMLQPDVRGDTRRMAEWMKRYPGLLGFASDQDLQFLADVAALVPGPHSIWGIEQAQCAARYLEELETLAPAGAARKDVAALLADVRAKETTRATRGDFLYDASTLSRLQELQKKLNPPPGSRADFLLTGLVTSAEIYSYHRRARSEKTPSLYQRNNTVREAWLKRMFVESYRREARDGHVPRALFKLGVVHTVRGRSPLDVWTTGNLAHELAAFNGMKAYGILVLGIGGSWGEWKDLDGWLRPLLPAALPATPLLVELEPLRGIAEKYAQSLEAKDRESMASLIHGFEAVVLLPHSRKADWTLTGFPVR